MTAIAGDWHEELHEYPAWALQRACRWWMGADNPDRRRKPLAGDIAARAKREMGVVDMAKRAVSRVGVVRSDQEPVPPCSADTADEIMRAAGFKPKTFGGAS